MKGLVWRGANEAVEECPPKRQERISVLRQMGRGWPGRIINGVAGCYRRDHHRLARRSVGCNLLVGWLSDVR